MNCLCDDKSTVDEAFSQSRAIWVKEDIKSKLDRALEDCSISDLDKIRFKERISRINEKIIHEDRTVVTTIHNLIAGTLYEGNLTRDYLTQPVSFRDSETVGNLWYVRRILGQVYCYLVGVSGDYDSETVLRAS